MLLQTLRRTAGSGLVCTWRGTVVSGLVRTWGRTVVSGLVRTWRRTAGSGLVRTWRGTAGSGLVPCFPGIMTLVGGRSLREMSERSASLAQGSPGGEEGQGGEGGQSREGGQRGKDRERREENVAREGGQVGEERDGGDWREGVEGREGGESGKTDHNLTEEELHIHRLHTEACEAQRQLYVDPESGYEVITAFSHRRRGRCCGAACRHCPYGQVNVKSPALRKRFNSLFYV